MGRCLGNQVYAFPRPPVLPRAGVSRDAPAGTGRTAPPHLERGGVCGGGTPGAHRTASPARVPAIPSVHRAT